MTRADVRAGLLLLEDSADDVLFFRRGWTRAGAPDVLRVVEDGVEAVAYLEGEREYRDRSRFPLPAVVVLDLKVPRKPGLEVLAWIRNDPRFRELPAIVLTSSREPGDMARARELGIAAYYVKPVDFRELNEIVRSIAGYWASREKGGA